MINNETSSYIDLTPLYGHTQDLVDKIRLRDGTGCLHPDCFAEDRLLFLPPAVSALLVLFNRNHNVCSFFSHCLALILCLLKYIASRLLDINEGGTFRDPRSFTPQDPDLLKQDEHIFQVARLNNSTWCASIVFSDYLGAILGMVRDGNNWSLNPFRVCFHPLLSNLVCECVFFRAPGNPRNRSLVLRTWSRKYM